jgi:hypothetical protein
MVTNLIRVCMVCEGDENVIPKSVRRKGLGYKSSPPLGLYLSPPTPYSHLRSSEPRKTAHPSGRPTPRGGAARHSREIQRLQRREPRKRRGHRRGAVRADGVVAAAGRGMGGRADKGCVCGCGGERVQGRVYEKGEWVYGFAGAVVPLCVHGRRAAAGPSREVLSRIPPL